MKKKMLLYIIAILTIQPVLAQQDKAIAMNVSFSRNYSDAEITKSNENGFIFEVYGSIPSSKAAFEEEHYLGDQLSGKWTAFNSNYTRVYDVSIGITNATVEIVKPIIYKAVNKVNNYYKKQIRKGNISKEEAIRELSHILDCANVVCFEDNTTAFENAVSKAKTPEEIISVFNKVTIKFI